MSDNFDALLDVQLNVEVVVRARLVNSTGDAESGAAFSFSAALSDPSTSSVSYSVNWGDGASSPNTTANPSHSYTFNTAPNANNSYAATMTAQADGTSYTSTQAVQVYGSGSGSINLIDGGSIDEGSNFSLTMSFSDQNQTAAPAGAGWAISWGDGTVSRSSQVQSTFTTNHQYNEEGDYQIEVDAIYREKDTDSYQCEVVQHDTASVRPGNPLNFEMNVGHVSWSDSVGVSFIFGDADGDNPTYTVSWGDGSTDTGTQSGFSHTYAYSSSGKTYSITGSGTTDDGTFEANSGTASIVSIDPTTLSLSGGGVAYEQGQQPAYLYVSRTGDTSQPLSAALNFGGTEESSEYQLIDPDTGQNIGASVTIPAHQSSVEIEVIPLDDSTPEWTETIDATLQASGNYDVDPNHDSATISVADNDLGVTLGNGSDNIILQGSSDGKQNLVPLTVDVPAQARAGATITLSETGGADVWSNGTQIVGYMNGTFQPSYTWTDAVPPTTLQVGGVNASSNIGDLSFTLYDSDAASTIGPPAPTVNTASSKPATVLRLGIIMYNDPNGSGDFGTDIAGMSHDWLVGQLVDVNAVLAGPVSLVRSGSYLWAGPPGSVAHNILEPSNAVSRQLIPLQDDNAYGLVGGQHASLLGSQLAGAVRTGLQFQEINFFWSSVVSTDTNTPDIDTISVNVLAGGSFYTASSTFKVYAPGATAIAIAGTAGVKAATFGGWDFGLIPTANSIHQAHDSAGIVWQASVATPTASNFQKGLFRFVQKTNYSTKLTYSGYPSKITGYAGFWVLDTSDPYDNPSNFDGVTGWITDNSTPKADKDSPTVTVNFNPPNRIPAKAVRGVQVNNAFQTFLMYQPPGLGSQWVPLQSLQWSYSISATLASWNQWTVNSSAQNTPTTFSPATQEPEWDAKLPDPIDYWEQSQ